MLSSQVKRCRWALGDPLLLDYHDKEWGVPLHDDRKLFEFLILEGAQAGLNWLTVLKKRGDYRRAYSSFRPFRVARFDRADVRRLLSDKRIIRNRLKIVASINNARRFIDVKEEFGSFDRYIWLFTNGKTLTHRFRSLSQVPAKSKESEAMSRDLQKRGFNFVGPTICYAFMQAVGIVNDHIIDCFRYKQTQ